MTTEDDHPEKPPLEIHNVFSGTAEYVIQVGYVAGDFNVHRPATGNPLRDAANALATATFTQWREEAAAWQIGGQYAIPVRWSADWSAADHPQNVGESLTGRSDQLDTLVSAFLGLGSQRLVAIGGPGAGKTTMVVLFTLRLLHRRIDQASSGPVPVILTLESWDAERVHFRQWLEQRLREDHPGLPRIDRRHPASRLVNERLVLPVLDGLDELPPHRRNAVIQRLRELDPHEPLVLTCRESEYRAVTRAEGIIPAAAVIAARPIDAASTTEYLRLATDPQHASAWNPILEELRRQPDGAVAQALSSPLMIWLARRTYSLAHRPLELLDADRFPDHGAIEHHLLDNVIQRVFADAARPQAPARHHPPRQWHPDRARRWLTFIARHLKRQRTGEFAWWRLYAAQPAKTLAIPALVAICAVLGVITTTVAGALASGDSLSTLSFEVTINGVLTFGVGIHLLTMTWFGLSIKELAAPRRRANPFRFGTAVRSAARAPSLKRGTVATVFLVLPTVLFALMATRDYLQGGAVGIMLLFGFPIPALLTIILAAPSDTMDAATPDTLMRGERRAILLTITVVAPVIGVGHVLGRLGNDAAWGAGLLAWLSAVAVLTLVSPWSRWLLAKCVLAGLGRVPWCTMEFLRDSHRLGLLTRSGGVYRFRHHRLREHLTAKVPLPSAPSIPDATQISGSVAAQVMFDRSGTQPAPARNEPEWGFPGLVEDSPERFVVSRKSRRLILSIWTFIPLFIAFEVIMALLQGDPGRLVLRSACWVGFGVLVMLIGFAWPPKRFGMTLDRNGVGWFLGKHEAAYRWADIETVSLRRTIIRKQDAKHWSIQLKLRAGVELPHRKLRCDGGWLLVLPMGIKRLLPPNMNAAMQHFAGDRWQFDILE